MAHKVSKAKPLKVGAEVMVHGRRCLVVAVNNAFFETPGGRTIAHRVFLYAPIPKGYTGKDWGRKWQNDAFISSQQGEVA